MWALVEDGNVIEVYSRPKSIVLNNVRYPSNMFTLYTEDEKKQLIDTMSEIKDPEKIEQKEIKSETKPEEENKNDAT